MDDFDSLKLFFIIIAIGMIMVIGISIAGFFFYESETFTATVTSIDYFERGGLSSGSQAVVKFDDGHVYSVGSVPDGLREGYEYTIEYRKPSVSLTGDGIRLVVLSESGG
ncbi:MAG: hypothetical protein PHQ43_00765 [Dehalococcoidales bacterium]|nr:hypothetical protein [Dehalococcoidales bacterium]